MNTVLAVVASVVGLTLISKMGAAQQVVQAPVSVSPPVAIPVQKDSGQDIFDKVMGFLTAGANAAAAFASRPGSSPQNGGAGASLTGAGGSVQYWNSGAVNV